MKNYYNRAAEVERIKQIDLVSFLASFGFFPKRAQAGKAWFLSPLVEEKNASFCVFLEKNRFKCFASGHGGSIIDFCIFFFGLEYTEAIKMLREKYYHSA